MSDDLVKRMHNWNRCYPGNLNIECVWEEAIARIEALTAENAKLRARCEALERGYAEHCLKSGEWAWKGECDE